MNAQRLLNKVMPLSTPMSCVVISALCFCACQSADQGLVAPEGVTSQQGFQSPEAAMLAVAMAAESDDQDGLTRIFGQECGDVIYSDDVEADHADCCRVAEMTRERVEFQDGDLGRKIALLGHDAWAFPIPLTKASQGWVFDVEAGRDELLSRQIGENELVTVDALEEYVAAQREYARESRDGNPHCFAARFASSSGKHDGLYWETPEDHATSPLGPLVAAAAFDESHATGGDALPFRGYFYKALMKQGKAAPGGELNYVDAEGRLTDGCGALAWPAKYGESGITTFMVNHAGIVFEKDLGPSTEEVVNRMSAFEPDATWKPAER